jgi:hypothetical protein
VINVFARDITETGKDLVQGSVSRARKLGQQVIETFTDSFNQEHHLEKITNEETDVFITSLRSVRVTLEHIGSTEEAVECTRGICTHAAETAYYRHNKGNYVTRDKYLSILAQELPSLGDIYSLEGLVKPDVIETLEPYLTLS